MPPKKSPRNPSLTIAHHYSRIAGKLALAKGSTTAAHRAELRTLEQEIDRFLRKLGVDPRLAAAQMNTLALRAIIDVGRGKKTFSQRDVVHNLLEKFRNSELKPDQGEFHRWRARVSTSMRIALQGGGVLQLQPFVCLGSDNTYRLNPAAAKKALAVIEKALN